MNRRAAVVVVLLSLSAVVFGQKDLKSRADSASGGEKVKYAAEYAEATTKAADKAFQDGKDAEGSAELMDVEKYAVMASEMSIHTGKRQKQTEITLRKIVNHLADIKNARPFDMQEEVKTTMDAVDKARNNLLDSMFANKRNR
jgi:hypothetical protein